jgi:uncharacterized protein
MANRIAAITGASAGLGSVFARKLAARGYDLILIARRKDRLDALASELSRAHGVATEAIAADLTKFEDIDAVASRLAAEPRLSLLVNNAGFGTKKRFWEAPIAGQIDMHRLHIDATMRLTHAVLGPMVSRNEGSVINVSSVASFIRGAANVSYCATKSWMSVFTEALALELNGTGVSVQALCPGFTYTEFHDVMEVDRGLVPKWLWMDADFVVEESLAVLRSRKVYVIPGWKYRVFVAALTKLPVWLRLTVEGKSPQSRSRL